jgi:hypothetical protein
LADGNRCQYAWRKKPTAPWWKSLPPWQLAVIVVLVIAVAVVYALGWI